MKMNLSSSLRYLLEKNYSVFQYIHETFLIIIFVIIPNFAI